MTRVFDFAKGSTPLLISVPHDGRCLAAGQAERMTGIGRALPDTDWHVRDLYSFAHEMGASVIAANFSRYVVDLNRPSTDESLYANQVATGLCPRKTFAGEDIYLDGQAVDEQERCDRVVSYWRPYHVAIAEALNEIKSRHGYALLWDAHSIPARVPLLFDGVLPDLNIGTNGGASCADGLTQAVADVAAGSNYSSVVNGRFRGGHITRHFGAPEDGVHAVQLELTQQNYMDEKNLRYDADRAAKLADTIQSMLQVYIDAAARKFE